MKSSLLVYAQETQVLRNHNGTTLCSRLVGISKCLFFRRELSEARVRTYAKRCVSLRAARCALRAGRQANERERVREPRTEGIQQNAEQKNLAATASS